MAIKYDYLQNQSDCVAIESTATRDEAKLAATNRNQISSIYNGNKIKN